MCSHQKVVLEQVQVVVAYWPIALSNLTSQPLEIHILKMVPYYTAKQSFFLFLNLRGHAGLEKREGREKNIFSSLPFLQYRAAAYLTPVASRVPASPTVSFRRIFASLATQNCTQLIRVFFLNHHGWTIIAGQLSVHPRFL